MSSVCGAIKMPAFRTKYFAMTQQDLSTETNLKVFTVPLQKLTVNRKQYYLHMFNFGTYIRINYLFQASAWLKVKMLSPSKIPPCTGAGKTELNEEKGPDMEIFFVFSLHSGVSTIFLLWLL